MEQILDHQLNIYIISIIENLIWHYLNILVGPQCNLLDVEIFGFGIGWRFGQELLQSLDVSLHAPSEILQSGAQVSHSLLVRFEETFRLAADSVESEHQTLDL